MAVFIPPGAPPCAVVFYVVGNTGEFAEAEVADVVMGFAGLVGVEEGDHRRNGARWTEFGEGGGDGVDVVLLGGLCGFGESTEKRVEGPFAFGTTEGRSGGRAHWPGMLGREFIEHDALTPLLIEGEASGDIEGEFGGFGISSVDDGGE